MERVLNESDFDYLRQLIFERTGIVLGESKRELVRGRVSRRVRALGLPDFTSYCAFLRAHEESEVGQLINAVTTNVTAFMREPHHFEILAQKVLPAAAERNRRSRRLRIWSAGCSTGEEPWSIAMVLTEAGIFHGWDLRILATDIDHSALATAEAGEYPAKCIEPLEAGWQRRWLQHGVNEKEGMVRVDEGLRPLVDFLPLNLQDDPWPMQGPFDTIFCRNVMIYFNAETRARLIRRMTTLLRPGGYLFLGHSESPAGIDVVLERVGHTAYRRPEV